MEAVVSLKGWGRGWWDYMAPCCCSKEYLLVCACGCVLVDVCLSVKENSCYNKFSSLIN